jgi:hypothetical protein
MGEARTEPDFSIPLEPGKTVKRVERGIYIQARNMMALEVVLEVSARPRWEDVVDAAVQEAAPESPELQGLSASARDSLSSSLEEQLSGSETGMSTGSLLARAIDLATRTSPEIGNLSPQSQALLLVNILGQLPKEERDIAIPIFSMQSAERLGERVVTASWALVGATIALVLATIALIVVTA